MICIRNRLFTKKVGFQRCLHSPKEKKWLKAEEIKIPVPWGHVSGKWWGKKNVQPIIAVHGFQDNAGSWDPFCELLPNECPVLAIDLPGHGFSSHLPLFQNYNHIDFVATLRRVRNYLEEVKSYFGVDHITDGYETEEIKADSLCHIIDEKIKYSSRDNEKSTTRSWDDIKETWIDACSWTLNEKSAEILMKRGVVRMAEGKYKFSRDQRMKAYEACVFTPGLLLKLAEKIKCDVRLIKATDSEIFNYGTKYCPNILDIVQKKAKSFKLYIIEGKHHLHMDVPEKIVPLFLELHRNY